ncbi:hypothetical protein CDL15_Pgr022618 [Punica granatum]|uniref:Uncharacterized protein n=1 Tax=Punica granatum TaxID=22663 RepID=A0A218XR93_PUNGR|nr:hypothetical protein CDL15_Pgr022618 [Punica granatum]
MLNHILVVLQLIPDNMEFQSDDMPNCATSNGLVSSEDSKGQRREIEDHRSHVEEKEQPLKENLSWSQSFELKLLQNKCKFIS